MECKWKITVTEESPHPHEEWVLIYSIIPSEEEKKGGDKPRVVWQRIGDELTDLAVEYDLPFEVVTEYLKKTEKHVNRYVSLFIMEN